MHLCRKFAASGLQTYLYRDENGDLVRSPAWRVDRFFTASRYLISGEWTSPNYTPTDPPGPYGRSVCRANAVSDLYAADWAGSLNTVAGGSLWKYWKLYQKSYSYGLVQAGLVMYKHDTMLYSGQVMDRIRITIGNYASGSGAGAAKVGVVLLDDADDRPAVSALGGVASYTVEANGTYELECEIALTGILGFTAYIDNFDPPTDPYIYPGYARAYFSIAINNIRFR